MKATFAALLAGFSLVCSAPRLAHHAVGGEYDPNKPIKVTGHGDEDRLGQSRTPASTST